MAGKFFNVAYMIRLFEDFEDMDVCVCVCMFFIYLFLFTKFEKEDRHANAKHMRHLTTW